MSDIDMEQAENARKIVNARLSKLTNEDILHLFDEANRKETSISRIKEIVEEISGVIGIMLLPVAHHHLYRARNWSNKTDFPKNISDLLEPISEYSTQNRCNIKKKPILYVSNHPVALISECHFEPGDIFAMAQFDRTLKTEDLSCMMLGTDPHQRFEGSQELVEMAKFKKSFFGENFKKYEFIERQLHKQFVKEDDEEGIVYRFTAHLCEKYFSSCPDLDAILYPSIATQGSFTNLAIRPKMYSKTYVGKKVGIFETLPDNSFRQLMGGFVEVNGNINWEKTSLLDNPKAVGIRSINPDDPRIYIAPWK